MMYLEQVNKGYLNEESVIRTLENAHLYSPEVKNWYDLNADIMPRSSEERRIIFNVNHEDYTKLQSSVVVCIGTNCFECTEYFVFVGAEDMIGYYNLVERAADEFRSIYNIPIDQPLFYTVVDASGTITSLIGEPMIETWWIQ